MLGWRRRAVCSSRLSSLRPELAERLPPVWALAVPGRVMSCDVLLISTISRACFTPHINGNHHFSMIIDSAARNACRIMVIQTAPPTFL